jgi:hypothetical protein
MLCEAAVPGSEGPGCLTVHATHELDDGGSANVAVLIQPAKNVG